MTASNRWPSLINHAISKSEQGQKLTVHLTSGLSPELLQPAIEAGLIGPVSSSDTSDLMEFISSASRESADLIIAKAHNIQAHLSTLYDPALRFVKPGQPLCQITVVDLPGYRSLLVIGNKFGETRPTLTDKIKTTEQIIRAGRAIGLDQPKVAVLAAVEVVYPQMPVTCDGAVLAKMSERGQIKHGLVDGPLSLDVAIDAEVAQSKGVLDSSVAGRAEGFLAPDSPTAGGMVELMQKFAKATVGGLILGGARPIITVGPLNTPRSLLNSITLATLLS